MLMSLWRLIFSRSPSQFARILDLLLGSLRLLSDGQIARSDDSMILFHHILNDGDHDGGDVHDDGRDAHGDHDDGHDVHGDDDRDGGHGDDHDVRGDRDDGHDDHGDHGDHDDDALRLMHLGGISRCILSNDDQRHDEKDDSGRLHDF
ncbi:hypothetical protein CEXT_344621 [Caerostris extrusa]|uniref:Uncharacterized protein n=1 Tax=Caerostris extrusa TaxID=172846 RepID=A0AAV4P3G1_CAEEX|nr:hypothetical protein CEXT_344621 [Caerostris extrusa]